MTMTFAALIHAAVPAGRPVTWAASRLEIEHTSDTEITLTRRRLNTPELIWSLPIDVTGGQDQLAAGACMAIVMADWYLLLKTEAEYCCGETLHNHRLHHISSDGRILWTLPWQTADQVGLLGDRFVVIRFLSTLDDDISQPPLVAHLIDPRNGRSLMSHAISIPDELLPLYERALGSSLRVSLENSGHGLAVRVMLVDPYRDAAQAPERSLFVHPLPFGQPLPQVGFLCPDCLTPGALQIAAAIQLPADSRSDEIALQVVTCESCGMRAVAVYEESRRGSLAWELWEHAGYRAPADVVETLCTAIAACPDPTNPACTCAMHQSLGRRDGGGRWRKPSGVEWQHIFPMRLAG